MAGWHMQGRDHLKNYLYTEKKNNRQSGSTEKVLLFLCLKKRRFTKRKEKSRE